MITSQLSGYFDLGYDPQRIQTGVEGLSGLGAVPCPEDPSQPHCLNLADTDAGRDEKKASRLSDCEAYKASGKLPQAMRNWPPAGVTPTAKQLESHARSIELFKLSCDVGAYVNSAGVADKRLRFAPDTKVKPWMVIAGVLGLVGVVGAVALSK